MDDEIQQCSGPCGRVKPLSEFSFRNLALDVRHGVCRECYKAWNRSHYERNRATYIANARRNGAVYHAENLRRVVEYLTQHPCVDCGETDLLVLDFDHRDRSTKRMSVSNMLRYCSWAQIEAEMAKCDVRCANDHRRRTARQLGWLKAAFEVAAKVADDGQARQDLNSQPPCLEHGALPN